MRFELGIEFIAIFLTLVLCRYSAGKVASMVRELKQSDFDPKEKFWTRFPSEGSKITPPHQSAEFRWKDYCPVVFRYSPLFSYFYFLIIIKTCLL